MAHVIAPPRRPTPSVDYPALAELRHQIRQFLRSRETSARTAGVEPQQYLLLLQVKGLVDRPTTIGALAERLQINHHAVVQLINRLAARGMVRRQRDTVDRRHVVIVLRPRGETVLRRLALQSVAELKTEGPALVSSLKRLIGESRRPTRPAPRGRGRTP